MFAASGMDIPAFDFLNSINIPFLKIGSGDTNNLELIEHVAKYNKPTILSTGMNDMKSVTKSLELAQRYNDSMCLLQCTSSYPLPNEDVNLNVIKTYQKEFGHNTIVGYSGHETVIAITLGAIAMGAKIIERHVTIDKTLKGTDHSASLEPDEFKELCDSIRTVEKAMGSNVKTIQPSEKACHDKLGKSLVTTRDLKTGHVLTKEDMTVKVADPMGVNPTEMFDLVGKTLKMDIYYDNTLNKDHLC
jgi:sialic acid synthase